MNTILEIQRQLSNLTVQDWIKQIILTIDQEPDEYIKDKDIAKAG
jgi:hypothetical protein